MHVLMHTEIPGIFQGLQEPRYGYTGQTCGLVRQAFKPDTSCFSGKE